jgi:aspartyl-tRNA(Asn)/glutamyl-tRNA(Gln) amidotransferase subunit A
MRWLDRPIVEIAAAIRAGEVTPTRLVEEAEEAYVAAEMGTEPINAFIAVDWPGARRAAAEVERRISAGEALGPMAGIPVAVKDNLSTVDFPTTCGSRILSRYTAPYDATAVRRLREGGAIVVGKANLDEMAMGSSGEESAFGVVRNPRDRGRAAGGSSSGSAAAVAAGIVPAALGSDTGGSVRQPAAFCGVAGIKPTYGMVSRYGMIAFASSLDHVGTFGRTVGCAALALGAIAGRDARDATSADRAVPDFAAALGHRITGLVIGVPGEVFTEATSPGVRALLRASLRWLEDMGAEVREVSLPHLAEALPAYKAIAAAEAASNLARFDGVRFGERPEAAASFEALVEGARAAFGAEAKRRILLGTHLLTDGRDLLGAAQAVRALVAQDFRWIFSSGVDAVFTPTAPWPAFLLGAPPSADETWMADTFTVPANVAGLPAVSLPIGNVGGMPVGGQLVGAAWSEPTLVRIADALERVLAAEAAAAARP